MSTSHSMFVIPAALGGLLVLLGSPLHAMGNNPGSQSPENQKPGAYDSVPNTGPAFNPSNSAGTGNSGTSSPSPNQGSLPGNSGVSGTAGASGTPRSGQAGGTSGSNVTGGPATGR